MLMLGGEGQIDADGEGILGGIELDLPVVALDDGMQRVQTVAVEGLVLFGGSNMIVADRHLFSNGVADGQEQETAGAAAFYGNGLWIGKGKLPAGIQGIVQRVSQQYAQIRRGQRIRRDHTGESDAGVDGVCTGLLVGQKCVGDPVAGAEKWLYAVHGISALGHQLPGLLVFAPFQKRGHGDPDVLKIMPETADLIIGLRQLPVVLRLGVDLLFIVGSQCLQPRVGNGDDKNNRHNNTDCNKKESGQDLD